MTCSQKAVAQHGSAGERGEHLVFLSAAGRGKGVRVSSRRASRWAVMYRNDRIAVPLRPEFEYTKSIDTCEAPKPRQGGGGHLTRQKETYIEFRYNVRRDLTKSHNHAR